LNTQEKLEKALSDGVSVVALRQLLGLLDDGSVVRVVHHSDDHGTYYNGVVVEESLSDTLTNLTQAHMHKQGQLYDEKIFLDVLEVVIQRVKEMEADDLCTQPVEDQLGYLMDYYEEDEASIAHQFQNVLDSWYAKEQAND